jgi:hypothetical protein
MAAIALRMLLIFFLDVSYNFIIEVTIIAAVVRLDFFVRTPGLLEHCHGQ